MTNFVSSMSQLDKVLHLYVEVRSVEDGKELLEGDHRSSLRMLQCPDVLPLSHRELVYTSPSHSPDFYPRTPHRSRAQSQSLPPPRYSSGHTVNFQLPHQNDARCPTTATRRSSLSSSVGQRSDLHTPGMSHSVLNGPYLHHSDVNSQHKWVPSSSAVGRWSVPSTPTSCRRFYDSHGADDENGTMSVVRYGYVEKASVNTGSQRPPHSQYDTDHPFQNHILLQKRNSDPGWHYDPEYCSFSNYSPVNKTHTTPPQFRRSTCEAVAKDATHRAVRQYGSPELKRRHESYIHENGSINLPHHQQPRQSWSSSPSPSLHKKSPTLPSRCSQYEVPRSQGHTGVTAPHTPQHCPSPAASPSLSACRFSSKPHQQLATSQHTKSYTRSHLPAGKPTDIQHTISTNNIPTYHDGKNGFHTSSNKLLENGCTSIPDRCNLSNIANQRHAKERSMTSPENELHVPLYSNLENGPKFVADGKRFSQSDQVRMSTSPVPSIDSHALHSANTTKTFYCKNQPNASHLCQKAPHHLPPHYQTDKKDHRSPQTMRRYGSPLLTQKCLSSSKSLSLPSSLNHTDFVHCPEMQSDHSLGFNNVLKPENNENQLYPFVERRPYHQVSVRSIRSSPEVTRRSTTSVNRTSKCEVQRGEHSALRQQKCENQTSRETQEVKSVKNTHEKVCLTSAPSKVLRADAPCKLGPALTGSSTENCTSSKVGWKCPLHTKAPPHCG